MRIVTLLLGIFAALTTSLPVQAQEFSPEASDMKIARDYWAPAESPALFNEHLLTFSALATGFTIPHIDYDRGNRLQATVHVDFGFFVPHEHVFAYFPVGEQQTIVLDLTSQAPFAFTVSTDILYGLTRDRLASSLCMDLAGQLVLPE